MGWLQLRLAAQGLEARDARHGSVDAWQLVDPADAQAQMAALLAFNDGSSTQYFARLTVPVDVR